MYFPSSGKMFLQYGHRYPSSIVTANADLEHKDRSHVPIGTSVSSGNIVVLTRKYKQDHQKIDELLSALNTYNTNLAAAIGTDNSVDGNTGFGKYDGALTIFGSLFWISRNSSKVPKAVGNLRTKLRKDTDSPW
jgi:hypothetical protein